MTRAEALRRLPIALTMAMAQIGGLLLLASSLYFFVRYGWLLAAIPEATPDDGLFGRTLLQLAAATAGALTGALLFFGSKRLHHVLRKKWGMEPHGG